GTSWPPPAEPDAAVAQPSGAVVPPCAVAAAPPYVGVERPSLVEATARPSSAAERPSAAVMPERRALPAVGALPRAPPMVAGLAAVQAAIEVSEQSQQRALAARRRRVAGQRPSPGRRHPVSADQRALREQSPRWQAWNRGPRRARSEPLI